MVLTYKKDWSPDLSYSSLVQDQKVRVEHLCSFATHEAGSVTSAPTLTQFSSPRAAHNMSTRFFLFFWCVLQIVGGGPF